MKYVIGVDGGATKTQCALYDVKGNFIDLVNWGATNHDDLKGGLAEMKDELEKLLSCILSKNGITVDDITQGVFGLAGVDTREQHKIISGFISGAGLKNFILCNDSFLGIKAGCSKGYGICVINGTGCSVTGIDESGRTIQIGGQGNLTGDIGGGGSLGAFAVQSVYNYLFKCGEYTLLMDMLFKELNAESKYDFIENLREKINEGTLRIAELNRFIFDAANLGDKVSLHILEQVGRDLGASVNGAIRELDFDCSKELEVVLAGSVNVKGNNPTLVDSLKDEVVSRNKDRNVKFILLDKPPVMGAIVWALGYQEGISK